VLDGGDVSLAVVTGAASGIGAATAERLRASGFEVLGIDLADGPGIRAADVTDAAALDAIAASLAPDLKVAALVCAAGIWLDADDRYAAVDPAVWDQTWKVNVTGTMLTLRAFAPLMGAGASVTTIASVAALVGIPKRDAYTASKGAVLALSRAWAADLIGLGVRVNCVCPGVTETPMAERVVRHEGLDLPLGRAASPDEVAAVIALLASPESAYVNGAVIPVDAGFSAAARSVRLTPRWVSP
jgi:NAD(P)-dependent dehydrogenase (short-subunit alcohol dehydrogenase family)